MASHAWTCGRQICWRSIPAVFATKKNPTPGTARSKACSRKNVKLKLVESHDNKFLKY